MKKQCPTYKGFLDAISNQKASIIDEHVETIVEHFKPHSAIHSHFTPTTFLLDYATRKYLYVEKTCFNLLGYTAEYFLETGLDIYMSKWHKTDLEILNTKVFVDNFSFLKAIPFEDYSKYIFSYNYRMKNANGEYITVLQRMSYILGKTFVGPAGVIGVIFDITHFKNDIAIIHTIEKVENTGSENFNRLVFKKVHAVVDQPNCKLLSEREREILSMMAKGLSSKQIASCLQLSTNTINNHRKNMLNKTNCKTASELMSYASKHGLV